MKYYVVDAFADGLFKGNPAGVCIPDKELDAETMQKIAFENNLAETAFLTKNGDGYALRWFTPETEIDLCGHATLATAYILMVYLKPSMNKVSFSTQSGMLTVEKEDGILSMDFPSRKPVPCAVPDLLEKALGAKAVETHLSRDLIVLLENEEAVRDLKPDLSLLSQIKDAFGFAITAKGNSCDFVSRFFTPGAGIPEDPVTGSSHCSLIPFWSERLGKTQMTARQLSKRGGTIYCEDRGSRVKIGGKAVCYLKGELFVTL
jgi:PhzF family phenazine biosynthesis protein